MTEPPPRTAIIVPLELPAPLERIRQAGDPMTRLDVPAHVTLLFPFMPRDTVGETDIEAVAAIVARQPAFEVALADVRRFPSSEGGLDAVLWLAPEPAEPFVRLTSAIATAYPAYPPYGGDHDEVIPHLTMATADPAQFDRLEAEIRAHLPVRRAVDRAALLVEDAGGRWSTERRFPLG